MTRSSARKRKLLELETEITSRVLLDFLFPAAEHGDLHVFRSSGNGLDDFLAPENVIMYLEAFRYLNYRDKIPKSIDFVQNVLPLLDDYRFKQEIQMTRSAFNRLAGMLTSHAIFSNRSNCSQISPNTQLMVAFHRFGCNGNGASVGNIARHFGMSEGAVELCTNRSLIAILSLENDWVRWPDLSEKIMIKERILEASGFPDCVGFVDGGLMVLEYKPGLEGSDYWSHKHRYGITALVVCDDLKRIRHLEVGFCGSAHDNRVFDHSRVGKAPGIFFQGQEYLLADSAFSTSTTVVASYKKPLALHPDNKKFNTLHSQQRIAVEHCIGIWKGRFQSLRGIRTFISNKKDHQRVVYWIRACSVLHNLLIQDDYDNNWTEAEPAANMPENVVETASKKTKEGQQKREKVKQTVLKNNE